MSVNTRRYQQPTDDQTSNKAHTVVRFDLYEYAKLNKLTRRTYRKT